MTIGKITQILEEWAPLDYAEDFDNCLLYTSPSPRD